MLKKALKRGQGDGMDVEVIRTGLLTGKQSMWVIHEEEIRAAVVVSLTEIPTVGEKVVVELLAGEGLSEWADELQDALNQAREISGAFCIEASCRPGLAEFLKQMGWRVKSMIMESPK